MGFLKRALASITRKKAKTAIMLVLVFLLGNVVVSAILIERSIKNTENSIFSGQTMVATVDFNYSDNNLDWENIKMLTVEQIEELGALEGVSYFDYSDMTSLQSKTLKQCMPEQDDGSNGPVVVYAEGEQSWFTFTGNKSEEILAQKMGKIKIVEGRALTAEEISAGKNVVIISKKLAELNNLAVGSLFTLEQEIYKYEESDTGFAREITMPSEPTKVLEFEFTVVGLYDAINQKPAGQQNDMDKWQEAERLNMIYTSNNLIKNLNDLFTLEQKQANPEEDWDSESRYLVPFFVLEDAENLQEFKKSAENILPNYYIVTDNTTSSKSALAPLENMSTIARIIFIVGVSASLLILSLLITLFLRDRRKEIGIYLSLGEQKIKVVGQLLTEVFLIAIIAFTLALFSGYGISNVLSSTMMENEVLAQQEAEAMGGMYGSYEYSSLDSFGYGAEVSLSDLTERYSVSFGADIVLYVYLVGLLTVLVSTLVPIIYVLRLNPRRILL